MAPPHLVHWSNSLSRIFLVHNIEFYVKIYCTLVLIQCYCRKYLLVKLISATMNFYKTKLINKAKFFLWNLLHPSS